MIVWTDGVRVRGAAVVSQVVYFSRVEKKYREDLRFFRETLEEEVVRRVECKRF